MRPRSSSSASLTVAALLLSAILFGLSAHKPLHLDNMDFAAAAEATAQSGLPVYYRGEQLSRFPALYHPPLFIYSLAAWVKCLGPAPQAVRFFGFFCLIVHGFLTCLLFSRLLGCRLGRQTLFWFCLLLFLNPYTLQTASIVDIDSTVYGPALSAILLLALDLMKEAKPAGGREPNRRGWLLLICAICAAFWMKLTTVIILLPGLWLLFLRFWGWRGAMVRACGSFLAGFALFAGSYLCYGLVTGLDTSFSYSFLWQSFAVKGSQGAQTLSGWLGVHSTSLKAMSLQLVTWAGPAIWILLGTSTALAFLQNRRGGGRRAWNLFVVNLICIVTTLFYCFQTLTFGGAPFKYPFVFWPLAVMNGALLASGFRWQAGNACWPGWMPAGRRIRIAAAAAFLFSAFLSLLLLKDRLIVGGLLNWAGLWGIVMPGLIVLGGAAALLRKDGFTPAAHAALAGGVLISAGIGLGVAVHQARADYSTTYDYGQRGFEDTVAFIRLTTSEDQMIASMKDIGYAARRKYWETYGALYGGASSSRDLIAAIQAGRFRYVVFTETHGQDQLIVNPRLNAWINSNCRMVRSLGDYRIYEFAGQLGGRGHSEVEGSSSK